MFSPSDIGECKEVFAYFQEISRIPRGSGHTAAIASYLVSFAKTRGLFYVRDDADNVIIRKAASAGYEDHPPVILQGHTDMVPAKVPSCSKDMDKEGVDVYLDGDFLRAAGTTLGADDGIAIAYALAILADDTLAHPPLEALFTSDEEVGLIGAAALDVTHLCGTTLINIDSDAEGCFTVGCAGGVRCDLYLPMKRQPVHADGYTVHVSGLSGGHSGMEIDKGRANALRLLGDCLRRGGVRVADIAGGSADNAIAAEASATVCASEAFSTFAAEYCLQMQALYADTDPSLTIQLSPCRVSEAYTEADTQRLLSLLTDLPNGVIAMSEAPQGLVQTSLNCGIAHTDDNGFALGISVRSSVEEDKGALVATLRAMTEAQQGTLEQRGDYPAWEYRADSPLCDTACRVYRQMYGKEAKTMVIHAGLECGVFAGKIPSFDAISLGPDNFDLHTPDEHMSVSSACRVYRFLTELLRQL